MRVRLLLASFIAGLSLVACSGRESPGSTPAAEREHTTASATAPATAPRSGSPTAAAPAASGPPAFDGERALAHLRHLANDLGDRVAGSADEKAAAEYARDQLRAAGYAAEVQEFTFDGDRFRSASVTVDGRQIEALTMAGSGGGRASGPAVFVGLADAAGIGGRDLRGRVAVADRGTIRFGDKWANAKAAGAVALVVINNDAGELSGNLGVEAGAPVVGVAQGDGELLRDAGRAGREVTVETPAGTTTTAYNVLARARLDAPCRVLVGAHHDTVPGTPGAHDNASGTAETIELARAFAADGLDAGLCFATFGAEESGLFGSAAMARALETKGELPLIMVNLDTTASGSRIQLIGTAALTAEAATVARGAGIEAEVSDLPSGTSSDHASFAERGVEVLFFATDDFTNIHTPRDTVEAINPGLYARGGELAYDVIRQFLARVARG